MIIKEAKRPFPYQKKKKKKPFSCWAAYQHQARQKLNE